MNLSRKNTINLISNINFLKNKYKYNQQEIERLVGKQEYEHIIQHYNKLIDKLNQQLLSLPIGFRYKGVFYIKNTWLSQPRFDKYEGVVYMREDLVSWQIEEGLERPDCSYHRNIYKLPQEGAELRREDAEPVYAEERYLDNQRN